MPRWRGWPGWSGSRRRAGAWWCTARTGRASSPKWWPASSRPGGTSRIWRCAGRVWRTFIWSSPGRRSRMKVSPPDAYWKKDVVLFFGKRFALAIKLLYPMALIVPVAASDIPAQYAAAVIAIVTVMAGTFGAGESLTADLNDGILLRLSLTPLSPRRMVFELLAVNAVLDFIQLLPALLLVYVLHPAPLVWVLAATFALFTTLVTANCIGIFIANFTSSPADVLLYATAMLAPLIYLSGFFRNQNPTGLLAALRDLIPFAYTNDALKAVFGLTTRTTPLEVFVYPTPIAALLVLGLCLTAPRLLSPRL